MKWSTSEHHWDHELCVLHTRQTSLQNLVHYIIICVLRQPKRYQNREKTHHPSEQVLLLWFRRFKTTKKTVREISRSQNHHDVFDICAQMWLSQRGRFSFISQQSHSSTIFGALKTISGTSALILLSSWLWVMLHAQLYTHKMLDFWYLSLYPKVQKILLPFHQHNQQRLRWWACKQWDRYKNQVVMMHNIFNLHHTESLPRRGTLIQATTPYLKEWSLAVVSVYFVSRTWYGKISSCIMLMWEWVWTSENHTSKQHTLFRPVTAHIRNLWRQTSICIHLQLPLKAAVIRRRRRERRTKNKRMLCSHNCVIKLICVAKASIFAQQGNVISSSSQLSLSFVSHLISERLRHEIQPEFQTTMQHLAPFRPISTSLNPC